ncbi:hypothetical protein LC653_38885 [Nostoc sp. CHAB 5784]|uniref:hypothetical protein n=1 Tax=Nostoc mirabile TaxID=2907820 RepID=UPI001E60C8ED|nr:hypothetical protein [Nostoc mirabile]MCC5669625.1 hypothetical protein [Nostoc mirabile CHAB5784]
MEESKKADYHLLARNGQYWIMQATNSRPCAAPIPEKPDRNGYTSERARQVILRLEHIARWTNILELESPATSQIKPGDVEIEIIAIAGNQSYLSHRNSYKSTDTEIRLEYTYENGEWRPPALKLRLTNHSQKDLYCNVLNLEENYVVDVPFFDEKSSIRLVRKDSGPDATIESFEVDMVIPDDYLAQGITEYTDIFKLIVSNADFDASLLQQDGLDLPPVTRSVGSYSGTLNRLMEQVGTRKAVRRDQGNYDDWMTKLVKVIIVMPRR